MKLSRIAKKKVPVEKLSLKQIYKNFKKNAQTVDADGVFGRKRGREIW
jgi:hypothetical protein